MLKSSLVSRLLFECFINCVALCVISINKTAITWNNHSWQVIRCCDCVLLYLKRLSKSVSHIFGKGTREIICQTLHAEDFGEQFHRFRANYGKFGVLRHGVEFDPFLSAKCHPNSVAWSMKYCEITLARITKTDVLLRAPCL